MEKLNGKKKLIVSVFISGRGTNLKSLINFSKYKNQSKKTRIPGTTMSWYARHLENKTCGGIRLPSLYDHTHHAEKKQKSQC